MEYVVCMYGMYVSVYVCMYCMYDLRGGDIYID